MTPITASSSTRKALTYLRLTPKMVCGGVWDRRAQVQTCPCTQRHAHKHTNVSIAIHLDKTCKCTHTQKGSQGLFNPVKPETTDHCCAITFLQKRTERSEREKKKKRKRGLCQETHPTRPPLNGLYSIRPHSWCSQRTVGSPFADTLSHFWWQ